MSYSLQLFEDLIGIWVFLNHSVDREKNKHFVIRTMKCQ